jgi:uncharacterized damage-inducible protein DinB
VASEQLGGRAEERALLCGFLDWYRAVVVNKVHDLSLDAAACRMTPTGLSPLGIVAHLAAVEYGWFDETFLGHASRDDLDQHGNFQLSATDTVASVVAEYELACADSRRVVAGAVSLDDLSVRSDDVFGNVSLRWVLVHMIDETARHAGHLDILREQIDGRTGD